MNPSWQEFIAARGGRLDQGRVQDFGDAASERLAARDSTVLCDLGQLGVLRVSGDDAAPFLNNMLSNDVNALATGKAQHSSFNTAKGRVLATLTVCRRDEDYLLLLSRDLAAAMQKKLSMYVLRSKVKVEDFSTHLVCLGLSGPTAESLLQAHFPDIPQEPLSSAQQQDALLLRCGAHRFLIAAPQQQAMALWDALAAQAKAAGAGCWDWLDIRDGLPRVTLPTQEAFVLQMINLDVIGGVSFKKGCYPGQEVVARMHYLGKPKRRMFLAHAETAEPPQAGAQLFSADVAEQASGEVVLASAAPQGGFDLLAVVNIASQETQPVHLGNLQGPILQFSPLPYALP